MFVNKKAKFEYEFIRTEVAGIQLCGSEVKSIHDGKLSMTEAFCVFIDNELYVKNINISGNNVICDIFNCNNNKNVISKHIQNLITPT